MIRSRDVSGSTGVERPAVTEIPLTPYLPDRDLTVYRDGIRWSFSGGKILLDGQDVNRLVTHDSSDVGLWMGLAQGLDEYRKKISREASERDQFGKFQAVVEALLGKILGRLKKAYDQKMSGLSWTLENGQLILNGINIRSFLALYKLRKTDKAKRFLKGLRTQLAVLLENPDESPDYERIHKFVEELFQEINSELEASESAPRSSRRLLPRPSHHP